jgi:hypothetical protein
MIKRQFHEPRECDASVTRSIDFALNFTKQFGMAIHAATIAERPALMKAKEHLQGAFVLVRSL